MSTSTKQFGSSILQRLILTLKKVPPVEIREIPDNEITPEMRKAADEVYNMKESELTNISLK